MRVVGSHRVKASELDEGTVFSPQVTESQQRRKTMDKEKAKGAVRELLLALDQDIESEGLRDTPRRVAEMYFRQCSDEDAELGVVFQEEKFDGLVMVRDIPFVGCCEHHLVFFFGRAHVAYIPNKKLLGISKLARLVYSCSRGFGIQERVTMNVADRLYEEIEPKGVMVVLEAQHGCMNLRGARAIGSSTVTSAIRGVFRDVVAARSEFLNLVLKGGPR